MMIRFLVIFISRSLCSLDFPPLTHRIKHGMDTCTGRDNFGGGERIVGEDAQPALKGSWPWLVRIEMSGTNRGLCGGTIISDDMILTGNVLRWF